LLLNVVSRQPTPPGVITFIYKALFIFADHTQMMSGGLALPTLPLSGRQEAIAIEADSMAACPLEGFVRRASCAAPRPSQTMAAHVNQLWILH
jgi:hypothetical protein